LWGDDGDDFFGSDNVTITYTCSHEFLSMGVGNQIMVATPFDIGLNGELFLDQVQQNLCVNGANNAVANSAYGSSDQDWQNMTTAKNGMLDVPAADMGMHYDP
jgi:hypothetical protein